MAANLNVTLKRGNGTDFDLLYPKTTIAQVIDLQTTLDAKIPLTQRGAALGVATLDSGSKLTWSQIPTALLNGGSKQITTMSGTFNLSTAKTYLDANDTGGNYSNLAGQYYLATGTTVVSWTNTTYEEFYLSPGDEGVSTSPVTLEAGDMLVFVKHQAGDPGILPDIYTFAVINNTYGAASTTDPGIVTISSSTSTATTGAAVITDGILNGLIGTAAGKIAAGDHNHNATYLGITANAASATKLATARSISMTGDVTWSIASFDGSANVTAAATLANSGVAAGTYKSVTVDAKGRVTGGTNPTTLAGYGIGDAQALDADLTAIAGLSGTTGFLKKTAANTWALDTSSFLTGNQTITVSGDASGSGTTSISLTLANTGVAANTYRSVTVDAKGRVTAGTNPTTLAGYGITDAYTQTATDAFFTNRPEIFYDTTVGAGLGDIIIDVD